MTFAAILITVLVLGIGLVVGRWGAGRITGGKPGVRIALTTLSGSPYEEPATRFARAGAGTIGWYLATAILGACALLSAGSDTVDETSMRVTVAEGGPAADAGIASGDRIVEADGVPITDWGLLKKTIAAAGERPTKIIVERNGERRVFEPIPRGHPAKILVGPPVVHEEIGFVRAIALGGKLPFDVVANTVKALLTLTSEKPELSGPTAIVKEVDMARRSALASAFKLLAALAAYLLPLVALVSALAAIRPNRTR